MSAVANVRTAVSAMLDGMKFNREKLAKDCVTVCDAHDRLEKALAEERSKNAELAAQVALLKKGGAMPGTGSPDLGNIFGDVFKPTGKNW